MTHTEIRDLFEKKIYDAKALIEQTKNNEKISVKPTVFYCDDNFTESADYDEKGETSILADIEIRIAGRDGEDDPMISFGMLCDLKRGLVKDPSSLDNEIVTFDNDISEFVKGLSSAESTEDFITAEFNRMTEEGEQKVKELEEKLDKLTKYTKIGAYSVLAILFIVLLIKTIFA